MHSDLALVTSGGGMTCAYSVGAILALKNLYNITEPKWAIGSSGSTGTLAYSVAGQYHCFRNVWENLLPVKAFINLKRVRRIIDIDYLIDEVFKKQDPLDFEAIKRSPTELLIATTNCKTGKVRYFSNREDIDIFEALRASKAMPFVYRKRIAINGQYYFDGALTASVAVNIQEAVRQGAKKVIAIDNNTSTPFWNTTNKIISLSLLNNVGRSMRKALINNLKTEYGGVKIIHIKPVGELPVSLLDNNPEHIRATIDIGYRDVANNLELKELI